MGVSFRPATPEDVARVVTDLHPNETSAMKTCLGVEDPVDRCLDSLVSDAAPQVMLYDDEPVAVFGVVDWKDGIGCPYLFARPKAYEGRAMRFIRESQRFARNILFSGAWPKLVGAVWVKNEWVLRWLKRLGFTLGPAFRHENTGEEMIPYFWRA